VHVEETAVRLLKEYKPGRNLYPNVEFWAAAVLRGVRIPTDLYTPTFGLARMAGWSAHILEQADKNRLIRPESTYVGEMPKAS
jgi:citrate synthase